MRIVVIGPPGAGKGTQAGKLSHHYGIPHISTGELFRSHITQKTELGKLAQSYIDKGDLVPERVTVDMLKERLMQVDAANGFILDGFPRTIGQAAALQELLVDIDQGEFDVNNHAQGLDAVLSFVVSDSIASERMKNRGREDDKDDVIANRLKIYEDITSPLIGYYNKLVRQIDAEGTAEDVFQRTLSVLK